MALEDVIKELTEAVVALTEQLRTGVDNRPHDLDVPTSPTSETKSKKSASPAEKKNAEKVSPPSESAGAASSELEEPVVTLDELAKYFTELIAKDVAPAKAILQKYGVPKLSHLAESHYASALVDVKAALNG